jgi:folate-dependent phosphoribosylglycinamide formyltransferase PurN
LPKRIVFFSSQGPGNFKTVIDFCRETQLASVVHLICDRPGVRSLELAGATGIPASVEPIKSRLNLGNAESVRERIHAVAPIYNRLATIEAAGGPIDLIVLAFRKVLLGPILNRFGPRMINVHPSDLSVHNVSDRSRRYVGIDGLKRAIRDGNNATRTSIHRVDGGIDTGELLCLGPSVAFRGDRFSNSDIDKQEALQKIESDRPALRHTLHEWARGGLSRCAIL